MDAGDSGNTSEVEDHFKTWGSGSDAQSAAALPADDAASAHPHSDCGIGHRVLASRSVLALVIDEDRVFAGLQGGDIVVRTLFPACSSGFWHAQPQFAWSDSLFRPGP